MTTTGVREALAVLPSWRWSALYIAAFLLAQLITVASRVSGPLFAALGGYLIAGPFGAVIGLLIGQATHDGPLFSLVSSLLDDGADRLSRSMNRTAASVADRAASIGPDSERSRPTVAGHRPAETRA